MRLSINYYSLVPSLHQPVFLALLPKYISFQFTSRYLYCYCSSSSPVVSHVTCWFPACIFVFLWSSLYTAAIMNFWKISLRLSHFCLKSFNGETEKKIVVWEGKAKTSSRNHIENENTANITRPEINQETAELNTYIWGQEKTLQKKPSPLPTPPTDRRKRNRVGRD